jgi:predicted MFS family arabinose efflux permease
VEIEPDRYKSFLLTVLLVVMVFANVDAVVVGLVLQDMKADLHLSDTQLGMLTGIAFALFYSVMGIPIARWADQGNRVRIISIAIALWSAAMALCAIAGNFLQLLVIRVCVAVGEAGCLPTAISLIADHFTRAERPRAIATYTLGGPLAMLIGYFVAGWLNQFYGWRMTFVLLGLPGFGLAGLVWLSLREPRVARSRTFCLTERPTPPEQREEERPAQLSLKEVMRSLSANATFRHLLVYWVLVTFFSCGIAQFQPAFLIRSYGLQSGEVGTWFAVIYGLGGLLGTYWGGQWASRRAANNERLQLKTAAVAFSGTAICSAFVYLSVNRYLAFGLMGLANLMGGITSGPLFATLQTLVPPRGRATSIALVLLISNLIGMGLGPLAAGALSDGLRPWLGEESLRYALLALCPGYLWGGWHLWRASRTVVRDLEVAQKAHDGAADRSRLGEGAVGTAVA